MSLCKLKIHRWVTHLSLTRGWRECGRCGRNEVFYPLEDGKQWTYYREVGQEA